MPTSTAFDADGSERLAEAVRAASARGAPLRIVGGDTKAFYGRAVMGEALHVSAHRGVITYDPSELVITARAGTPIVQIEARLAQHDQMLAFEPPILGPTSTLGGVVAAGLAGPRCPFTGAVRDFVLGVTVLDGRGQALRLGGTVFKNVAGFDGFRPMAGALGCLGVLLDVSLRVVPRPEIEIALRIEEDWAMSRERLRELMRRTVPLSGAVHDGRSLHLRLSGPKASVALAADALGGEQTPVAWWDDMRRMRRPMMDGRRLWRLAIPRTAAPPALPGETLIDWAGGQIWLATEADAGEVRAACAAIGGHATLFRGVRAGEDVFTPLPPALFALHRRLKAAFDPVGVFNPGRMYEGL